MIESFPAPGWIDDVAEYSEFLFLPSLSRLAIALKSTLSVWDVRGSELLPCSRIDAHSLSFSSDGRLFACVSALASEIRVWKESPAGYILHQKIATVGSPIRAHLSPNGESILISPNSKIHLRYTKDPFLPSLPTLTGRETFVLVFSSDQLSAAFARKGKRRVTVLGLQSGDPLVTIDTDMGVTGLGVTGCAVVVVGGNRVDTWSLTVGDVGAKFASNMVRTAMLERCHHGVISGSVFPDLSHMVASVYLGWYSSKNLKIYDTSTGKCLADATANTGMLKFTVPS